MSKQIEKGGEGANKLRNSEAKGKERENQETCNRCKNGIIVVESNDPGITRVTGLEEREREREEVVKLFHVQ